MSGWLFDLRKGLESGIGVSFEGNWCFFKGSFDFLVEGAGVGCGFGLEKAAQQIVLLCSSARVKEAISGRELTLVATSGFLGGTAGHVAEAEMPWGKMLIGAFCCRLLILNCWGMLHFQHYCPL